MLDRSYPYGEGSVLQLRSAVSHLNEVWAVETAGRILAELTPGARVGVRRDAARWLYDESRHMLMGCADSRPGASSASASRSAATSTRPAPARTPIYRLGMLGYFETKNIGRKRERAQAFHDLGDSTSETDMEFDWADETLHAEYGRRWLRRLLEARGDDPESWPAVLERCEQLVAERVSRATPEDLERIRACADALVAEAARRSA